MLALLQRQWSLRRWRRSSDRARRAVEGGGFQVWPELAVARRDDELVNVTFALFHMRDELHAISEHRTPHHRHLFAQLLATQACWRLDSDVVPIPHHPVRHPDDVAQKHLDG